jgi:hypothetical protein
MKLPLTIADPNPCNLHDSKICIRGVKHREFIRKSFSNPNYQLLTPKEALIKSHEGR